MTQIWVVVAVTSVATLALKAAGPLLLGGRPLPGRVTDVVALAGPSLLGALVAIGTFGQGQRLVVDARVFGVGAAAVAIRLKAPVLLVVVVAAVATAVARALAG